MTNELATIKHPAFDVAILAGQVRKSTQDKYLGKLNAYLAFAGSTEAALNPATFAKWRTSMATGKMSPNTINLHLASVRSLLKEAASQGYNSSELAEQFKGVKGLKVSANRGRKNSHSRTAISKTDMNRLIDAPDMGTPAGAMHRSLLLTLATCGMRVSEAVSLKISDIQWETNDGGAGWVAYVLGKNMERPEARPLAKQAKAAVDQWLAIRAGLGVQSEYVFTGFGGRGSRQPSAQPINRVSAWEIVQRYAKATDLAHVKPHDFRRYVGTQLAKKDIRLAQKQLGHKRIETTAQHYVLDAVAVGTTDDLV